MRPYPTPHTTIFTKMSDAPTAVGASDILVKMVVWGVG
jgi:hypothetical protein